MFLVVNVATAATVAPRISRISVTPATATAGAIFKFSTTLSAPLIVGDKVKINVGSGTLIAMTGTETQYSLSQALFTAGVKKYTVGIYTSRGALRGAINTGTYKVTSAAPVNHAPTLTLISSDTTATANTKYTVTLNAKDVDANLGSITMNWGDSTSPDTLTATDSKDLVFNHTYAAEGDFSWNAFASDKGTPVLKSKSISKIVIVSNLAPVEVKPPVVTVPIAVTYPVTESYDVFKKMTSYIGVTILSETGEKAGFWDLRSKWTIRAFKILDSFRYQIYMSSVYVSWTSWRYYDAVYDLNGNSLPTTTISSDVGCQSFSCTYREDVGANVTREYLTSVQDTGIKLKISGTGGEEIFQIPADYIKSFLAAVPAS